MFASAISSPEENACPVRAGNFSYQNRYREGLVSPLDPLYCTSVEKNGLVTVEDAPRVNEGAFIVVVEREYSRFDLLFAPEAYES